MSAALETILRARALAVQGHTQRQIAQVMGVSQPTVGRYIKASLDPGLQDVVDSVRVECPTLSENDLIGIVIDRDKIRKAEIADSLSSDVKAQLDIELERLDSYNMELDRMIKNGKWDVKLAAIKTALQVHDRRAKYLGLDTAFKYEGTSTSTTYVVNGIDSGKLT